MVTDITNASLIRPRSTVKSRLLMDLEVLTPIHIGTREGRLGPTEFVAAGGMVHLIDEDRLGRLLMNRNLVDAFVMEVRKGPLHLASFLRNTARLRIPEDLHQVCSFFPIPGGDPNMQDFRPVTRDASGQLYIPGSSLKGVFRTALLYRILKKNQAILSSATSKISKDDPPAIQKWRKFYSHQWLQEKHVQSFALPGAKAGPNSDILRCLTVRDAYPVGKVETRVIKVNFISRMGNGTLYWSQDKKSPRDLFIWVEAVTAGTFRMELSWDNVLYSYFQKSNQGRPLPVSGLQDLLQAVKEMNDDLVSHEQGFYSRAGAAQGANAHSAAEALKNWYCSRSERLFRVGFGSGMLSTTVGLVLDQALRQKIRDACGSGARPGDPAPKSRRVWRKAETEVLPMGWFAIKDADRKKNVIPPNLRIVDAGSEKGGKKRDSTALQAKESISPESTLKPELPPEAPTKETWDQAEVRWDRGKNEVTASFHGKKAVCRASDLQGPARGLLEKQKKGKTFKARVIVEVISENYRKILDIEA